MKPQVILDIECYPNYFLANFLRVEDNKIASYEQHDDIPLDVDSVKKVLDKYEVITFNGNNYDIPMLRYAMTGANNSRLKSASNDLIDNKLTAWNFEQKYNLPELIINHIDIIEVCPLKANLKIYGGRLHSKELQDLPYEPNQVLTMSQKIEVKTYCGKDLKSTLVILNELQEQIKLRRQMSNQYNIDLRSKSDAQIAEEVIKTEITRITRQRVTKQSVTEKDFVYIPPKFIKFKSSKLTKALDIVTTQPFKVTSNDRIEMPKDLMTLMINIGSSTYQMGMGGLHSTEKSCYHIVDRKSLLCDWDVASYYPSIILNCELYPKNLGRVFLDVYRNIVNERLEAKRNKDKVKADSLKITINGSFGKLGSPYSALYAPELMIQVTVTGQLALLMLIDELESNGIPVISGNTDGIVAKCPKDKEELMINLIKSWEKSTGFDMERTDYSGMYSRDVNNYICIKTDGKVKTKGCFSTVEFDSSISLKKNPQNEICNLAVVEYLKNGTEFSETLKSCTDITKFITLRTVQGGAVKGTSYLGKSIRWYYAKNMRGTINYKNSGNMVPRTYGAKPIMDLPEYLPQDIDYDWYIRECEDLLGDIGMSRKGQMNLF